MGRHKSLSLSIAAVAAIIATTALFAAAQKQSTAPPVGSPPAMMQIKPPQGLKAKISDQDRKFLKAAAQINLTEIKLGQMAAKQGGSQAVQNLGQRLEFDHKQLQNQLKQLGDRVHVSISTSLDDGHQAKIEPLKSMRDAAFDSAYLKMMIQGHKKAIRLFGKETRQGSSLAVMNWATEAQQILRIHESLAQQAQPPVAHEARRNGAD